VTRVMTIDPFRQESFSAALATSREGGAPTFRSHPGTETVLALASSFRWLISAFHKAEKCAGREFGAVTLGWSRGLSMYLAWMLDLLVVRTGTSIRGLPARRISANKQCNAN